MNDIDDYEKLLIVLTSIRNYSEGKDIYTLITEEACRVMSLRIRSQVDTQEIYDFIISCFDLYNDFVREKKMDLPLIPDEAYDLVLAYLNGLLEKLE